MGKFRIYGQGSQNQKWEQGVDIKKIKTKGMYGIGFSNQGEKFQFLELLV